jgi:hypothetical protein
MSDGEIVQEGHILHPQLVLFVHQAVVNSRGHRIVLVLW